MTTTTQQQCWLPCNEKVYRLVTLVSYDDDKKLLTYLEEDGGGVEKTEKVANLYLKNPEILIGHNDLTTLSYLHEAAVLNNLQYRFCQGTIYTYCGIVLVAINPYQDLDIYSRDTIYAYRNSESGSQLDPHIFAVAEKALSQLQTFSTPQSLIVSGESGAGKTVSAKYAMRYFADVLTTTDTTMYSDIDVDSSIVDGEGSNTTQLEAKVLASQPILEAIGNAKTKRNDNSSRFGKYIELQFTTSHQQKKTTTLSLHSASLRTYLLEKSRITTPPSVNERNYHIFYQLCSSQNHPELSELFLSSGNSFTYTKNDDKNISNDVSNFLETQRSLVLLGFGLDERRQFYKVLSSVLQLGEIGFVEDGDHCKIVETSAMEKFCSLLGLSDVEKLKKALLTRDIKSGNEKITKKLNLKECHNNVNSLAKLLYSSLFDWVVGKINHTLLEMGTVQKDDKNYIGVLDIYGFETFESNSFEQFCINYANEKLQQQFNLHVFKLEQEEYVRENLEWSFISYYDNQPCIDLIEQKLGILSLLDEESKLGSGSDSNFILKLHKNCHGEFYQKPKFKEDERFIVVHFAGNVEYEGCGFIEKNRDRVEEGVVGVCVENPFLLTNLNFSSHLPQGQQKSTPQQKPTVGSSFRSSLSLLMSSLNKTTPHYVRCIKPNDQKACFTFENQRAVQQLRACGVLETIRISAMGFPGRWTYGDFYSRYRLLLPYTKSKPEKDAVKISKILLEKLIDESNYKLGKTKIFFRAGQVAHLEKLRVDKLMWASSLVRGSLLTNLHRQRYLRIRKSALLIQTYGRALLARRLALQTRQIRAATKIQKNFRRFINQRKFNQIKKTTLGLQNHARGLLARRKLKALKFEDFVTKFQARCRAYNIRKDKMNRLRQVILAQCCIRRFIARKRLQKLKIEARSIEGVKKLNRGLELKIIELQTKLDVVNKQMKELTGVKEKFSQTSQELKTEKEKRKSSEIQLAEFEEKIKKLESENLQLKSDLSHERETKVDLVAKKEDKIIPIPAPRGMTTAKLNIEELKQELSKERELRKDLETKYETISKSTTILPPEIQQQQLQQRNNNYGGGGGRMGMIEYKQEDMERILRAWLSDFPPSSYTTTSPPTLSAYVIFMMIRYTDWKNDDEMVRSLLTKAIQTIKKLVRKKSDNLEVLLFALCTVLRLLHNLKQYGGDPHLSSQHPHPLTQSNHTLQNFDLYEYRQVLSDHSIWIYQLIIKTLEDRIQTFIVPGILESGFDNFKHRDLLVSQFEEVYKTIAKFPEMQDIKSSIFKQLFYYVCAAGINNLLLRRELNNWEKGIDIKFNISGLQEWASDKFLEKEVLSEPLAPLIQASHLLQARKTLEDAQHLVEMVDSLSTQQVIKLLNLYSPKDGVETKVSPQLVIEVKKKLDACRAGSHSNNVVGTSLLMDTKHSYAVQFAFNASDVKLEEVEINDVVSGGGGGVSTMRVL